MKRVLWTILLVLSGICAFGQDYHADNGWIVGHNLDRFNNRPLYLHNTNAFILTGDKPVMRVAENEDVFGAFYLSLCHKGVEKPFHEFNDIISMFRGGRMRWILTDPVEPSLRIVMDLVRSSSGLGGDVKVSMTGGAKGDRLRWYCGGRRHRPGEQMANELDVMGHPGILGWGIDSDFEVDTCGSVKAGNGIYLSFKVGRSGRLEVSSDRGTGFEESLSSLSAFNGRMSVSTPDPYLDAIAEASLAAVDGCWRPPVFVHGCMQWNSPFPGWRSLFGGIAYGWHDRVQEEAAYYIDSQVKQSSKDAAKADPARLLTIQDGDSRFYGEGRIMQDQGFYDMQSQFFDQLVEEYRWTGSDELVSLLRPALELHLKWMEDCFDPDGDGLYESYINVWPSDSYWYNGGGSAEETSYAYRGHRAALDMALAAKDSVSAMHHRAILRRIREGFFSRLWLEDSGHSGSYREAGGYGRVHRNPWLYSIFLPIDAGLLSTLQAVESLYYTEWALQNETRPGERMVWASNLVPAIWSVRELWPGDNYHLALSYYQAGMPEEAYELLKGTLMHTGYRHLVPGNLGSVQGGIDFADCLHPFARTLVSGLFGYNPDYPNGTVKVSPSFPGSWENASISLPDYSLEFKKAQGAVFYDITLSRPADIILEVPLACSEVHSFTVDGAPADFIVRPRVGGSTIVTKIRRTGKASVAIGYEPSAYATPDTVSVPEKGGFTIGFPGCKVEEVLDPQKVLGRVEVDGGTVSAEACGTPGNHTAIFKVINGSCEQWRLVHLEIPTKKQEDIDLSAYHWTPVDISGRFNADVREIFKQEYLSPRPRTVSVSIGSDGYSPWTFTFWNSGVPEIGFEKADRYILGDNLETPQGVAFKWNGGDRNIAFTSLWDNYPSEVSFDMEGRRGRCMSFLVCGSTNVMQCEIENAEIVIRYADGSSETLGLVPPFNYWNLCRMDPKASGPGQSSRDYYDSETDRFCLRGAEPATVELGDNCTAIVLGCRLNPEQPVKDVTLRCLSQEVVVGMMGISLGE